MRVVPLILAIVANVFLALAICGFGSLLEGLFPSDWSGLDRAAITFLGGMGLLGTALFDVGQARFSRGVIVLVLGLGALASVIRARRGLGISVTKLLHGRAAFWPMLGVAIVLAITAAGGLVRPTGDMDDDSIAYHFLGAKVWLRDGAIRPVIDEPYTSFPAIVESSYGALMAIGGERAPEFFAVSAMIALLLVTGSLAIRLGAKSSVAWWAVALVATMPAVYRGAYGGFLDVIYAAFVLAAARIGFDAVRLQDFALFGIFCGFAFGTKYTGLIAAGLAIVCAVGIALALRRLEPKTILKSLAVTSAAALAVGSTAYIRNWIVLGCPIYPPPPHFARFFSVKYMPADAIRGFHEYIRTRGAGMGRSLGAMVLLPTRLTYYAADFNGAGGIGLAPLALGPFGIFLLRRDWLARTLLVFAALLTLAWFLTEQESRFLIHVYVISAVFGAFGIEYVAKRAPRFGPVLAGAVLACSTVYGLFMIGRERAGDLRAVISASYAEKRRRAEVPYLESFEYLNREADVTKVLILAPLMPSYYCDKDYVKPVGAFGARPFPEGMGIAREPEKMAELGVSHVLDVRWKGSEFELVQHQAGLRLVFARSDQRIYRVEGRSENP